MKKTSMLSALAIFLIMLCGCGRGELRDDRLVMWHVGPESQARTIMKISREFTLNTGIEVVCEAVSWSDAHSKYLTSIAGGVSPDIGSMGLTWGMEFGELGALIDLRKNFPEDVGTLEENIFPGILESTRIGERVFGIPFDISPQIMYYRTDLIPEPPSTWEDLIDVLDSLRQENRGMILDWGSLEWIGYAPFLWQAGGDFYSEDFTEAILDSPEAVEALSYMALLYGSGVPRTHVPLEQGMRTGDYPLAISGDWKIVSLVSGAPEISGKWAISPLPEGPCGSRTSFLGGKIMSIFSRSSMKQEAWEFIKFLFKPENQIKIYEATLQTEDAYLPPNMDSWELLPMEPGFKKVLKQQAMDAKGPPPVRDWDSNSRFVNHAIQMVVLRGADPEEELRKANSKMQEILEK